MKQFQLAFLHRGVFTLFVLYIPRSKDRQQGLCRGSVVELERLGFALTRSCKRHLIVLSSSPVSAVGRFSRGAKNSNRSNRVASNVIRMKADFEELIVESCS